MYRVTYHSGINFPFKVPIVLEVKSTNMSLKEQYPFENHRVYSQKVQYDIRSVNGDLIVETKRDVRR